MTLVSFKVRVILRPTETFKLLRRFVGRVVTFKGLPVLGRRPFVRVSVKNAVSLVP